MYLYIYIYIIYIYIYIYTNTCFAVEVHSYILINSYERKPK